MNWYEYAVIFGIGFMFLIVGGAMLARWLHSKGKIDRCKACGNFVANGEIEDHILKRHMK